MKQGWQQHREYIERKYREHLCDPSTGLDNSDIRAGLDRLREETRGMSHARVKALAFDYVLSNTRIDVSEHDWFVFISEWNEKSIDGALTSHWYREVRESCAPVLAEQMQIHSDAKTHLLYLDYCHSVPDWHAVLTLGFPGLKERAAQYRTEREQQSGLTDRQKEYFDSIDMEYDSILRFLRRAEAHAQMQANKKCAKIADCLHQLATGAPRTTYECLQAIWLYFLISEYVDCLQVRSFGNLDVMLAPYFRSDLAEGLCTEEDIRDYFAAFLMQASAMNYYWGHPFYMAGTNEDGSSAVNELSFLILDVYDELGIFDPKIQVKLNRNTPEAFVNRILDMIRSGHSSFNFVSEPFIERSLLSYGHTAEEARIVDITGCYEFAIRGDSVGTANVHINLPKAVELALHNGYDFFNQFQSGPRTGRAEDFDTFEQFYEAFITQMTAIYERGFSIIHVYDSHTSEVNPVPMFSGTIRTSLERAFDAYAGGAKHHISGVMLCCPATAADSLAMVKKYVYDKKELTLAQLRDLLDRNWEGGEKLRMKILNDPDKWGNNRDLPDSLFKDFTERLARVNNARLNARGGTCSTSLHNAKQFLIMGWQTAATPDGRFSGEECSKNATPVQGMVRNGVTGQLLSTAKLDSTLFRGDFPIDVALSPSAVQGKDGLAALRALLYTYLEKGGHAIHFNIFSPDTLRDAQAHPDKYKDLQIRVCGWNVLWNSLTADEQEFYIRQAEAAQ